MLKPRCLHMFVSLRFYDFGNYNCHNINQGSHRNYLKMIANPLKFCILHILIHVYVHVFAFISIICIT